MKNIFNRTLRGIKKGLSTPTLSPQMLNFQALPLIRLLRVIGGISMLLLLSAVQSRGILNYMEYHYMCYSLQVCYFSFITYI
jgi:hypothetical protein